MQVSSSGTAEIAIIIGVACLCLLIIGGVAGLAVWIIRQQR